MRKITCRLTGLWDDTSVSTKKKFVYTRQSFKLESGADSGDNNQANL
jgi:hypothetical protein